MKRLPSAERLRALLDYNPVDGSLRWKERGHARWDNKNAGRLALKTMTTGGYLAGKVDGRTYQAHRIIWKLVHGVEPLVIDHINGCRADNRICNLRSVTQRENSASARRRGRRSGPYRVRCWGVFRTKYGWTAAITVDGEKRHLAHSPCFGVALKARRKAEASL